MDNEQWSIIDDENLSDVPQENVDEYLEIFSFFDRDCSGVITRDKLGQAMREFGWKPTEGELQVSGFQEIEKVVNNYSTFKIIRLHCYTNNTCQNSVINFKQFRN